MSMKNPFENITTPAVEFIANYLQRYMHLTKEDVELLLQYCEIRHFQKKEIILKEGETDNYFSMVVKGLVRKFTRVNKNEVILQLATEGHMVHSETSFLTRSPSVVELETLEPTTLLSIRYDLMQEALSTYPKGEKLGRIILSHMYIKKDERKYDRATKTIRERFLDYTQQHPHMLQRVPQKYLASYLNIKPETFSRLKHLVKKMV
jgi:CRP-like cAMP-binding protein